MWKRRERKEAWMHLRWKGERMSLNFYFYHTSIDGVYTEHINVIYCNIVCVLVV